MSFSKILLVAVMAAGLTACVESKPTLGPDFGLAVRQDIVAQIADPDAHYGKTPSNGDRAALAQDLYRTAKVVSPSAAGAMSGSSSAGAAAKTGQ